MSIELKDAKIKLKLLEQIKDNPELILTELYKNDVRILNFLTQVDIDGTYIGHYIEQCLKPVPVFQDVLLKCNGDILYVSVEGLKHGKYKEYQSDDRILEIDMTDKTVLILNRCIKEYEDIINANYQLKLEELDNFWKKYENFTPKNRVKRAVESLSSKKKIGVRISDFFFCLTVPRKRVDNKLDEQRKEIEERNVRIKENYEEKIEKQKYYAERVPEHTSNIRSKQNEIVHYLEELEYVVKTEVITDND